MKRTVLLSSSFSRTFPDPIPGIKRHVILMRAIDIPQDIPLDPNPRKQNIDLGVYSDVRSSLRDSIDSSFHLKNKGITIVAEKVTHDDKKNEFRIILRDGEGIVDGGHTYKIILEAIDDGECPAEQYVRVEVITGLAAGDIVDIARGLNTAVQVQEHSLANLDGKFEWIKARLSSETYADKIAYKQNEKLAFDVREIIGIMSAFVHPNPKMAYTSKAACLSFFLEEEKKGTRSLYRQLENILPDLLCLYDYVQVAAKVLYNQSKKDNGSIGRAGGMTGVFESRAGKKMFNFVFMNTEAEYRMHSGVLYPILGSLANLLEDKNGQKTWRFGGFDKAKEIFNSVAVNLVENTYQKSVTYGRKPNAVGKDASHWEALSNIVGRAVLIEENKILQAKLSRFQQVP